jgi:hypothetical protein
MDFTALLQQKRQQFETQAANVGNGLVGSNPNTVSSNSMFNVSQSFSQPSTQYFIPPRPYHPPPPSIPPPPAPPGASFPSRIVPSACAPSLSITPRLPPAPPGSLLQYPAGTIQFPSYMNQYAVQYPQFNQFQMQQQQQQFQQTQFQQAFQQTQFQQAFQQPQLPSGYSPAFYPSLQSQSTPVPSSSSSNSSFSNLLSQYHSNNQMAPSFPQQQHSTFHQDHHRHQSQGNQHNHNNNSNFSRNNKNNTNSSRNNSYNNCTSKNHQPNQQHQQQHHHQLQPTEPQQEYYCEPCDKSFRKGFDYHAHCKTHEKCTEEGCNFYASKKVVVAHYHSAHGEYSGSGYKVIDVEGQRFNLLLGYSPKEIEEWKLERRKHFPSAMKVKQKRNQEALLDESGGIKIDKQSSRKRNALSLSDEQLQQQQKKKRRQSLKIPEPLSGGKKGSLLKKLFEKEILTEENLILQAIRFICKSNYFEKEEAVKQKKVSGSKSKSKESDGEDSDDSDEEEDGEEDHGQVIDIRENEKRDMNTQEGIQSLLDIYASSENDSVSGEESDEVSDNLDEEKSFNKEDSSSDEDGEEDENEGEEGQEVITVSVVNQS